MGLDTELRRSASSWEEALRLQIALIEEHGAMSMRKGNPVTSIYTTGQAVYGFALTARAEPICQ